MSLKHRLRDLGARGLWRLGLSAPARVARDRLTVVTFHRVLTPEEREASPFPGLAVTPRLLDGALAFFATHFTCLPLARAWQRFRDGERPARPLLAVTFDDGRIDGATRARALLARHRVGATFFVPSGFVGRDEPMWQDALAYGVQALVTGRGDARTWLERELRLPSGATAARELPRWTVAAAKELPVADRDALVARVRERAGPAPLPDFERAMDAEHLRGLLADGHEVGSHSASHAVLRAELGADLEQEVAGSKRALEALLGRPVTGFCYPTGVHDGATREAVARAGYAYAVTTAWGGNRADARPFELRRFDVEGSRNADASGALSVPVLAWRLSELPGAPA